MENAPVMEIEKKKKRRRKKKAAVESWICTHKLYYWLFNVALKQKCYDMYT